jgi:hypothetical protein
MVMTPFSTRAQLLGGSTPDASGVVDGPLEQAASRMRRSVAAGSSRRETVGIKEAPFLGRSRGRAAARDQ